MLIKKQGWLKGSFDKSWGVQNKAKENNSFKNWGNLWGKMAQEIRSFYTKQNIILKKLGRDKYSSLFCPIGEEEEKVL